MPIRPISAAEGRDVGLGIAVDNQDRAYVTGMTESSFFPTVNALRGLYQDVADSHPMTVNGKTTNVITHYLEAYGGNTFHGIDDAFVTRINAGGTGLEYSSYLGGGGEDIGEAITVDSNYCAYVVGVTSSGNFPVTNALGSQLHYSPAAQPTVDAFVSKLSADGRSLVYSTYLGGNSRDAAMSSRWIPFLMRISPVSRSPRISPSLPPTSRNGQASRT